MKRKGRRGLALILAFVLVSAGWMLPVSPVSAETGTGGKNTESKKPEVMAQTSECIILRAETNYEYAIETEKDNVKKWKWAEAGQYNQLNQTVIFTGLQAGREYRFACRLTGSEAVLYQNSGYTKPDTGNEQNQANMVQNTTQIPEVAVSAPQDNMQTTTGTAGAPENTQTFTEMTPDTQESADASAGTVPGTQNSIQAAEDTTPAPVQLPLDGTQTAADTSLPKADPQPPTPAAPLILDVKDTEITLGLPEKADSNYRYEYSMNGVDFQADAAFTGLTPNTEYKFCMRIPAGLYQNISYTASDISEYTAAVRTKESAPEAPKYPPRMTSRTDTSISLTASENEKEPDTLEYGMVISDTDIQWNSSGIFENLVPDTEYQFVVRRKADMDKQMPGIASDILKVSTLQAAAAAPSAPELAKRSDTIIVLKEADNQQYGVILTDGTIKWQDSTTFQGLKPSTEYEFVMRTKYDPEKAMESIKSGISKFKTAIAFQGAKITGIENGGSYEIDTTWTATAVGVGMENNTPETGDTRWVPRTWSWNGKAAKSWDTAPYTIKFKCTRLASYELTVGYQLEEYTGDAWQSAEYTNSLSISFDIIEKKVTVYTITAEAGVNGKINPSGNVEVEKGKDYEFTFTPNKGYRTAKVIVDGKQVTIKNNRYTFTNVQDNHKIEVTFEKDNAAPKTGDRNYMEIVLALFCLSGVLLAMLAYRKRKI